LSTCVENEVSYNTSQIIDPDQARILPVGVKAAYLNYR
jgi:hypothetical protein